MRLRFERYAPGLQEISEQGSITEEVNRYREQGPLWADKPTPKADNHAIEDKIVHGVVHNVVNPANRSSVTTSKGNCTGQITYKVNIGKQKNKRDPSNFINVHNREHNGREQCNEILEPDHHKSAATFETILDIHSTFPLFQLSSLVTLPVSGTTILPRRFSSDDFVVPIESRLAEDALGLPLSRPSSCVPERFRDLRLTPCVHSQLPGRDRCNV